MASSHMYYVVLDLEWNGSYIKSQNKYFNEIIDIGAVKLDSELNVVDKYSMMIAPKIGKKLNKYVKELTRISIDELELSNNTFTYALSKLNEFTKDSIILTWGMTDILTMMDNCKHFFNNEKPEFLKYYVDLQAYCQSELVISNSGNQVGLSSIAGLLNIKYNAEDMHRALADSELAARCFIRLFNKENIKKFIQSVDDKFYRRITFKNRYITNISSPLIDKRELYVLCNTCGERMQVQSSWKVKNRGFCAKVLCPQCRTSGQAIIRFKAKFDGIEIKRFVYPK